MSTIFGDKLTFVHEFGTYTLNGPDLNDWPGAIVLRSDLLDGWDDTVEPNVSRVQRGVGDGDYISKHWAKKSRMLISGGYAWALTRADLENLFDLLAVNAYPENADIVLTRHEPIPKFVTARVAGRIEQVQKIGRAGEGYSMRWSTTLLCPDPLKYDALDSLVGSSGVAGVSSGGRTYPRVYPLVYNMSAQGEGNQVIVYNRGTTKAPVQITIHGPLTTGWRVDNVTTGETSAFDLSLGVSDILVIDTQTKTALLNGSPVNGLIQGSWWQLNPRSNTIRLYGTYDPAANFALLGKSTWR